MRVFLQHDNTLAEDAEQCICGLSFLGSSYPMPLFAQNDLQSELINFQAVRRRLLGEIPDLDAETLADTLEGITDLKEMLAELVRSALEDEALAAGLSTRLSDMKARLDASKRGQSASASLRSRR